jgi:FdhD protein
MPPPSTLVKPITRLEGAAPAVAAEDAVAVEEPLEIRFGGRSVAVVMRTPGHDRELAAGFLLTEGIIRGSDDLLDLVRCRGESGEPSPNVIDAVPASGVVLDEARLTRHLFTASSCGICGKATLAAIRGIFPSLPPSAPARRDVLAALPARLWAAQAAFTATGGLHACAVFDADGNLEGAQEDVGRHNALDKVVGRALLEGRLPLAGRILLVSGRVSFELMQKALAAGAGCVAAISAPTTAAVEFAAESGQTLVGFLRPAGGPGSPMRMNVYAGTVAG